MSEIAQHIAVSGRVNVDDLDWAQARAVGLSEREVAWLSHFADIESQTIHYFLELSKLPVARDRELLTFLTMWNYEEYFHSHALTRIMEECGVKALSASERAAEVRANARFKATYEDWAQQAMAKLTPKSFLALWMTWGAINECLVSQGYEAIAHNTKNPVLAEICRRIAKQERRHFAYYFNQAEARLASSTFTQRYVRFFVEKFFSPVGSGVKSDSEMAEFMNSMLPGEMLPKAMSYVDKRICTLPGFAGFRKLMEYGESIAPSAPAAVPRAA